jgi:hypothetical protein
MIHRPANGGNINNNGSVAQPLLSLPFRGFL